MAEIKNSRRVYRIVAPEGDVICRWELRDEHGNWLGDVMLEYSAKRHQMRFCCISDFGNYAHRWDGCGERGYARFLLDCSDGYITDKLAGGHDEHSVLLPDETQKSIWNWFAGMYGNEDPDWLGEAHSALTQCESEADFFAWARKYDCEDRVYERFGYGWGRYLPGLYRRLLPELKRVLRKEIEYGKKDN